MSTDTKPKTAAEWADELGWLLDVEPIQHSTIERYLEQAMSQAREEALEEAAKECKKLFKGTSLIVQTCTQRIRSLKQPEKGDK